MPHLRPRHLQESFDRLLGFARVIGILGHRQVGKTTFLQKNSAEYVTLDDEDQYDRALSSPKKFVNQLSGKRSAIDECQLVPGLFPAIKVRIGTSSIPGRFILSGSMRFTSRKAIRESLTGRIVNQELLPFSLTEIEQLPNGSFFRDLLKVQRVDGLLNSYGLGGSDFTRFSNAIERYLLRGGFPAFFSIRDARTRNRLLRDMMETILDRDVRLVYRTSLPYQDILEYCAELAVDPLAIVRPTTLKARISLNEAVQKQLLQALEGVFLIRRIPVEGDYRGQIFWFEDQIERAHFAASDKIDDSDWITLVYRNLRCQFEYRVGEHVQYFHYRTRGGAMIPLGIRGRDGILGVVPINSRSDFNLSRKRSADSFLRAYNNSKVVFVTRAGKDFEVINDRILIAPAQIALFL